jgi:hypothetical protein
MLLRSAKKLFFLINQLHWQILDAASCEKSCEISADSLQIQQVVKEDMILVIIFLNTMIYENFILNEFNMLFGTV